MSELFILPVLNRLDKAIEELNEILKQLAGIIVTPTVPPAAAPVVITEPKRANRYYVFEIDTNVVRDNEPLGLLDMLVKQGCYYATYMTVLAVGGGFSYRVNDKASPLMAGVLGAEWEEFEVEEIYITNAAVVGTALIYVEYRVE